MGERVIHEGGDDAATKLASEIAKEELRKLAEALEKQEKEKNK